MSRTSDPLDTYLLRVLVALLSERNLTRVAIRMNQSQPAISTALRRLRSVFKDELLVRSANGMVTTVRGQEILATARLALQNIDSLVTAGEAFDPGTTQITYKVGCPDYLATVFPSGVAKALRHLAPGAQLLVHPLGPDYDFERALAQGELDVVIGNWPKPPESLYMAALLSDDIVCLMDENHPLARGKMTTEDYLRAPHVVPLPFSSSHRGVIDHHLATLRVTRNVRVIVPHFSMAPHMLTGSDLIFTISRHFAAHYAPMLSLAIVESPIDYPRVQFYQIWHARSQDSEAHKWLRSVLKDVANATVGIKEALP
ncbi:MAG: LysR family transcriptional regulator [Gammaproteobacteria bacterium]|nr:LysR family transcriptional regulator [Gammaproteobacteria bacterium]MBU1440570.1 LysR family transcriptional regulator [Gammaproteobacteria bacterium]MBU2288093.1 LysR family transcriptional regulator [Gammaproteobacteria bacterium]